MDITTVTDNFSEIMPDHKHIRVNNCTIVVIYSMVIV